MRKLTKHITRTPLLKLSIAILILALTVPFVSVPVSSAQGNTAFIRQVRAMESEEAGVLNPMGLAFSSRANAFQVLAKQRDLAGTGLVRLTPFSERVGNIRLAAVIENPINVALDNQLGRLLVLRSSASELLEVREDAEGNLDPGRLTRHNISSFKVQNPQGMTFDAASEVLYILDATGPQIVRVEPGTDGSFEEARVFRIDLSSKGLAAVRGLALEPGTGNLHVLLPAEQKLLELNENGEIVATRDLAEFGLIDPQGIVFAPSSDQTDDPSQFNLFLADSGQSQERSITDSESMGQIFEFSLIQPAAAAKADFTSVMVRTTDLSAVSPPSPDPSGIAYLPHRGRLMMSDGEVEETVDGITHFEGANLWELTLSGSVVRTANISKVPPTVVPMTDEPTGVAWNPYNGHYYFSDDNGKRVYDLNPGADGLAGTADDTWTFFSTNAAGNGDPEGIAFDSWRSRLFVADGTNREVYEYTLTGSLVNHFDVAAFGVDDPESVEFNPERGTLFVMSSDRNNLIIVETTVTGDLLQTIDISATGARSAAGLAYAPASNGSGVKRFYIVDRGVDNNVNPQIIDGKMHETTAPDPSAPPLPTPTSTATPMGSLAGKASLISPSGSVNVPRPTYTWNRDNAATWYYLWVSRVNGNGSLTTIHTQWYQSSAVCGASTCSTTPAVTLSSGNYRWWIQTWNTSGYGPWSDGMNFSLPAPPGTATLVSPSGTISNATPTYTWNRVTASTWYYLWVSRVNSNGTVTTVHSEWYESSEVCGASTCSFTPSVNLSAGNYRWWIQTWNAGGYGPWSSAVNFTTAPPGPATPGSPSGTIASHTPTYTWNAVSGATWYYLWVDGPSGNVIQQWYQASAICSGGTCSVTPVATLEAGAHIWWVRTWNSAGYGPWSSPRSFTVSP